MCRSYTSCPIHCLTIKQDIHHRKACRNVVTFIPQPVPMSNKISQPSSHPYIAWKHTRCPHPDEVGWLDETVREKRLPQAEHLGAWISRTQSRMLPWILNATRFKPTLPLTHHRHLPIPDSLQEHRAQIK